MIMTEELRKVLHKKIDKDLPIYIDIILKAYKRGKALIPFFEFIGKEMYRDLVWSDIFETPEAEKIKGRHIFAYVIKDDILKLFSYLKTVNNLPSEYASVPRYTPGYFVCRLSEKGKDIAAKLNSEKSCKG